LYSSFWPVNDRSKYSKYSDTKKRDGMLNMLIAIRDNVGDARNQEKHSKSYTNDGDYDRPKEESRVLHNRLYTFLC